MIEEEAGVKMIPVSSFMCNSINKFFDANFKINVQQSD